MKNNNRLTIIAAAASALFPSLALAGDLTGTNNITGALSSANGFQNVVPGGQAFVSGQQNNVGGNFNTAYGFGHIVNGSAHLAFGTQHNINGGGNFVSGFQNSSNAASLYNFVTGSFNAANGANAWIGGSNNTSTGNRVLLFGQFLSDGGNPGSVMLSDSNPFTIRTAAAPFTNTTRDTFNGSFDRGYFLFTNDGQGANPNAGLFVVPTPANTATVTNPAFVGVNTITPTQALDVTGNGRFSGDVNAATGTYSGNLTAASGTFTGNVAAASGNFTGNVAVASVTGNTANFTGNVVAAAVFGTTGNFLGNVTAVGKSVVVGEENLRMLRGTVTSIGTITQGTGFTVTSLNGGLYQINFSTAFSGVPSTTTTLDDSVGQILVGSDTVSSVRVLTSDSGGAGTNKPFQFIVVGPR